MASEVELALEGVVDRLDRLPDPAGRSVARRLAAAAGAGRAQPGPGGGQVLGLLPGESLVADQGQPGPRRTDTAGVREQLAGDLAFPGLRIGQAPGRRHLVRVVIRYGFNPPSADARRSTCSSPIWPAPSAGRSPARRRAAPGVASISRTGSYHDGHCRARLDAWLASGWPHSPYGWSCRTSPRVRKSGHCRRCEAAGLRWRSRPPGGRLSCPWPLACPVVGPAGKGPMPLPVPSPGLTAWPKRQKHWTPGPVSAEFQCSG